MTKSRKSITPLISIVIPVYNEEELLASCLDSIAAQSVRPYEVIVVDNNSTDASVEIAQQYDFVTVLHEPRQGISFTRDAGFNAASGDIIARTDADSVMSVDWVKEIRNFFLDSPEVSAVSGVYFANDTTAPRLVGKFQALVYQHMQNLLTGTYFLCGANMAIRRKTWRKVRGHISHSAEIDEDIDLTLCLRSMGHNIGHNPRMVIETPFLLGAGRLSLTDIAGYLRTWPRNYELHGMYHRANFIRFLNLLILAAAVPSVVGYYWLRDRSSQYVS